MFRKILLASDGSEFALRAAGAAAELAREFGAELTALHVLNTAALALPAGMPCPDLPPGIYDQEMAGIEDAVARRTGHVLEEAGVPYATLCEMGHPAEVIVRVADCDGYDLIVLGSRGLSETHSVLLGSTSNRVSHHARCPVLIVK